jgi:hypothetical protein
MKYRVGIAPRILTTLLDGDERSSSRRSHFAYDETSPNYNDWAECWVESQSRSAPCDENNFLRPVAMEL